MKKYYLHVNGVNYGPYSFEELRNMQLTREAMVWFQGMDNWKSAGEIPELSGLFSFSQPYNNPSSYSQSYVPPSYQQPSYQQPSGYVPPSDQFVASAPEKKSNTGVIIGIVAGVLVLFIIAIAVYVNNAKHRREQQEAELQRTLDSLSMSERAIEEAPVADSVAVDMATGSKFTGTFTDNDGGSIAVTDNGSDKLVIITRASNNGNCFGSVSGTATVEGDKLRMTTSDGCILVLNYSSSNSITVTEYGCSVYHGNSCNFEGTYSRQ